jgi:hypothetical protein
MTVDEFHGIMSKIDEIDGAVAWESGNGSLGTELTELRQLVTSTYRLRNPE